MYVSRKDTLIEVHAPAKLNLFLEVLARRDDGFHEIETLMVPISRFDTIRLSANIQGTIELSCGWALGLAAESCSRRIWAARVWQELPTGSDNLVVKALELLRQRAGVRLGAEVHLIKRIPSAAGLGGASGDAAGALIAASEAWNLGWNREQLAEVGAEVGSDVPFFLFPGPAVCRGRGERIVPVEGMQRIAVVVLRPPAGLSTPEVYRHARPPETPHHVGGLLEACRSGRVRQIGQGVFNRLQSSAERLSPWVKKAHDAFDHLDFVGHQMTGSGTAYFGICRHARHARRLAQQLRAADLGAVFSATSL